MNYSEIRRKTRKIRVGKIYVGGDAPVSVQSMTNVDPEDFDALREQILRLEQAGCEIVRMTVPTKAAAANIDEYLGFHSELPAPPEVPAAKHQARGAVGRINMVERDPSDRSDDFDIMEIGMTDEEAKQECSRCLRCDHYGYGAFRGSREERWTRW